MNDHSTTPTTDIAPDEESKTSRLYANRLAQFVALTDPMGLVLVAGRGSAKTSNIMASRSMRVIDSLPRHNMVWLCASYTSFYSNILPALIEGWTREGWQEGLHFVVNKTPPPHYKTPYRPAIARQHVIFFANGVVIYIVSVMRLEMAAGNSYVHIFADECRLIPYEGITRIMPAIRGMQRGTDSPYFLGYSFTTDYPDTSTGDQNWILRYRDEMNSDDIQQLLTLCLSRNEILRRYDLTHPRVATLYTDLSNHIRTLRKKSTLYASVSSFVNAEVLSEQYFEKILLPTLTPSKIRTSVLSLSASGASGRAFYPSFHVEHHCYTETEGHYDPTRPLEVSMDFGVFMTSLVVSQTSPDEKDIYFIKNFFVLRPLTVEDIAQDFLEYFSSHRQRIIYYYYDRAGNAHRVSGALSEAQAWQRKIVSSTVYSGWYVIPQSEAQATIYQSEEFFMADALFTHRYESLPRVHISRQGCPELIASLTMARVVEKKDSAGRRSIHKDKSSERNFTDVSELPRHSTNMSDAFKYRICSRQLLSRLPSRYRGFYLE